MNIIINPAYEQSPLIHKYQEDFFMRFYSIYQEQEIKQKDQQKALFFAKKLTELADKAWDENQWTVADMEDRLHAKKSKKSLTFSSHQYQLEYPETTFGREDFYTDDIR